MDDISREGPLSIDKPTVVPYCQLRKQSLAIRYPTIVILNLRFPAEL
jgi:hypothetical protein